MYREIPRVGRGETLNVPSGGMVTNTCFPRVGKPFVTP